ncbi:MAG TPA: LemA family protein [Rhizomicrobium sp.]|nr:LemA family protein [Rhizomicrobium sp.]
MSDTYIVVGAGAVTFLVVLGANSVYNWLIALGRRCEQAAADVDVQLRQRNDLIPNLVATVKGYAAHEQGTFEAVARARKAAMTAQGGPDQTAAEASLGSALGRLFAVAEQYPELKASSVFLQLQADLGDVENKIAAARRFLNNVVAEYNTTRTQFPANIIAAICRFLPRDPGIVSDENRGRIDTAPSVAF